MWGNSCVLPVQKGHKRRQSEFAENSEKIFVEFAALVAPRSSLKFQRFNARDQWILDFCSQPQRRCLQQVLRLNWTIQGTWEHAATSNPVLPGMARWLTLSSQWARLGDFHSQRSPLFYQQLCWLFIKTIQRESECQNLARTSRIFNLGMVVRLSQNI